MTNSFIRDNWACQRGKGTDDARDRMKLFLQRMYRKYGTEFYGLQIDLHGYYPNMRHDLTNAMLERKRIVHISSELVHIQFFLDFVVVIVQCRYANNLNHLTSWVRVQPEENEGILHNRRFHIFRIQVPANRYREGYYDNRSEERQRKTSDITKAGEKSQKRRTHEG